MTIEELIQNRNITEVLHFTTNHGSLGVLASQALKARKRLNEDLQLANIFRPNAEDRRRDAAWHDYVNLSVSVINHHYFGASAGNWHQKKGYWWCVLSFDPAIMTHPGVYFTTTNNIYTGVARGQGVAALEATFAPKVIRWAGNSVDRVSGMADSLTTCYQAEVLYPGEVSTQYLKSIYVMNDEYADELAGQMAVANHAEVEIIVKPELFVGIK